MPCCRNSGAQRSNFSANTALTSSYSRIAGDSTPPLPGPGRRATGRSSSSAPVHPLPQAIPSTPAPATRTPARSGPHPSPIAAGPLAQIIRLRRHQINHVVAHSELRRTVLLNPLRQPGERQRRGPPLVAVVHHHVQRRIGPSRRCSSRSSRGRVSMPWGPSPARPRSGSRRDGRSAGGRSGAGLASAFGVAARRLVYDPVHRHPRRLPSARRNAVKRE